MNVRERAIAAYKKNLEDRAAQETQYLVERQARERREAE